LRNADIEDCPGNHNDIDQPNTIQSIAQPLPQEDLQVQKTVSTPLLTRGVLKEKRKENLPRPLADGRRPSNPEETIDRRITRSYRKVKSVENTR